MSSSPTSPRTYEAIAEVNAKVGRPPPPCFLKCLLGLGSRRLTSAAAEAGVTYEFMFLVPNGDDQGALLGWVSAGKLKPIIDGVYPFEKSAEAAMRCFGGRAAGNVIVSVAEK